MSSDESIEGKPNLSKQIDILQSPSVRLTLIILVFFLSVASIAAALGGIFERAGQLAAVASAFATILLVSLTAQYAIQTQQLVEETKADREMRKEEREKEYKREVQSLRRGLKEEIGKVRYYEDLAENYQVGVSVEGIAAPSTIYESNADMIGLLSDDEVDLIVEYYTRLEQVENSLETQGELDTTAEMDFMTEYFERIGALLDRFIRLVTFGKFGNRASKQREKRIRESFEDLSRAQQDAIDAIEDNL